MEVKIIGRDVTKCQIVINDSLVSRVHLQIMKDAKGRIFVLDIDSTGGTFVNGIKTVGEKQIFPGDIIKIGNTQLDWQNYFNSAANNIVQQNTNNSQANIYAPAKNKVSNKKLIITFVIVILSVVTIYFAYTIIQKQVAKKVHEEWVEKYKRDINADPSEYFYVKTDFSVKIIGGIKDADITLYNNSQTEITKAKIKVEYITIEGNVYKDDIIEIENVASMENKKEILQKSLRGIKVEAKITYIYIEELDLTINF